MSHLLRIYWPSALVVVVIGYLSLASGSGLPRMEMPFVHFDKVVHAVMYAALAGALSVDMCRGEVGKRILITIALAVPMVYGGLLELMQPYFPPRTCDVWDWAADAMGALVGWFVVYTLWIKRHSYIR